MEEKFYCLTFNNVHEGMKVEKELRLLIRSRLIPIPRKISASCGMALRVESGDWDLLLELIKSLDLSFAQSYLIAGEEVVKIDLMSQKIN